MIVRVMRTSSYSPNWQEIDTVLVDMDGTLLDLAFDNFFWLDLVPSRYAAVRGLDEARARDEIKGRYDAVAGSLPWYCVDHWSRELGLDIVNLKRSHRHLIRYLPNAPDFLRSVRGRGKRLVVVTNAHHKALAIKAEQTGLPALVDELVSSHRYSAPKESPSFWIRHRRDARFDPERTLLIEDSTRILETARQFGIRHTVAIRRPDTRHPPRAVDGFDSVNGVADLI